MLLQSASEIENRPLSNHPERRRNLRAERITVDAREKINVRNYALMGH
jgi:hypothetical protein